MLLLQPNRLGGRRSSAHMRCHVMAIAPDAMQSELQICFPPFRIRISTESGVCGVDTVPLGYSRRSRSR